MSQRKTEKMHVPKEFFKFVREKKASNPDQFRTNYDVLDDLMSQEGNMMFEEKKRERKKGGFWGKF